MIRKTGLILIVVIPVAVALVLYLFRNQIVAGIAEGALAKLLNTEVDVNGMELDPFAMQAQFAQLSIVDAENPARYLLIAGPGKFDLNGLQLFAGKVIVNNLQIDNLGMGIPRPPGEIPRQKASSGETTAAGDSKPKGQQTAAEEKQGGGFDLKFEMPSLNLDALRGDIDVDLLTGNKKLASLEAIDQAEKNSKQRLDQLEKQYEKGNFESRFSTVKGDFKAIKFDSGNPKSLRQSLQDLRQANSAAKALGGDVKQFSTSTKKGYAEIRSGFGNIDKKMDEDIASIKSLANLGDLNASKVGQMLFGQSVLEQFSWIMGKMRLAKDMLGSDDNSAEVEPGRRAGRIITYPLTGRAYPTFLVESTGFSGFSAGEAGKVDLTYSGKMTGLSSNARVYGKPLLVGAKAGRAGASSWAIDGNFDHRKPVGDDMLHIAGSNVDLGEFSMSGGGLMPQKAVAQDGTVNISFGISGEKIQGDLKVKAGKLNFVYQNGASKGDRLAPIIRDLFSGIRDADLTAKLSGTLSNPKFNVKSSIDEIFWRRTKQVFNQRAAEAERKIRTKITARVEARRKEAKEAIEARQKQLTSRLDKVTKQVDAIKMEYERQKKAGEAKLKAALKTSGGDKLKEKAKKLFR